MKNSSHSRNVKFYSIITLITIMLVSDASHWMLKGHRRLTFKISVSSPHRLFVWLAQSFYRIPSRMEIWNVLNFPSFPFKTKYQKKKKKRDGHHNNSTTLPTSQCYGKFTIHIKYIRFVFHCIFFFSSFHSLFPFKITKQMTRRPYTSTKTAFRIYV